jgi:hypothetical protein
MAFKSDLMQTINFLSGITVEVYRATNYEDGTTICQYVEPYLKLFKVLGEPETQKTLKELAELYKDKKCSDYFKELYLFGEKYPVELFEKLIEGTYTATLKKFLQGPVLLEMVEVTKNAEYIKILSENEFIQL